jgi:hypothetical protein
MFGTASVKPGEGKFRKLSPLHRAASGVNFTVGEPRPMAWQTWSIRTLATPFLAVMDV